MEKKELIAKSWLVRIRYLQFIPKTLSMEFKAACKKAGQNINETIEEAVRDWISKQEQLTSKRPGNLYRGNFSGSISTDNVSQDIDLIFSTLPTIATAIEKTLGNPEWGLKHLAKETKISVSRLKKLQAIAPYKHFSIY